MKLNEFKLERFFAQFEFEIPHILCSSDCEPLTIRELLTLNDKVEEFLDTKLGYSESLGAFSLRETIAGLYANTEVENIITFSGAEEGIFIAMNVLLKPKDHVIVQTPAYQSLFEIANSLRCDITKLYLQPDWDKKSWNFDLELLNESITKKTKLIIINFPHNPTGTQISQKTMNNIIEIASDNDLYLFSDEVYRFLEYSSSDRLTAVCDLYSKGLSLGVMSKAFALAGLRIGWISTHDKDVFTRMAQFKDFTTICNSTASEYLAKLALENKESIIKRNLSIIGDNFKEFANLFNSYPDWFSWIKPQAGSVAYPKLNKEIDIDDFCRQLIKNKGVLLLPGTVFQDKTKHFRIGLGKRGINKGIGLIREFIDEKS
ncbi:MAG: aminotransferase class I/II-fold pyridoxal phosphate-dependent enzyme [Candidatus Hodarchaeales archaeon]